MKAQALIARAVKLKDGTVRLTGATWGDGTPIKTVEIKIDDGLWQPAKIDRSPKDKYTWRFFSYDWKAPAAGEHRIITRATDEEGRVQPEPEPKLEDRRKWKKTNWDWNEQWPWSIKIEA